MQAVTVVNAFALRVSSGARPCRLRHNIRVKLGILIVLVTACNARLGEPVGAHLAGTDAATDSMRPPVDAAPDARGCIGGDAHATDLDGNCYLFFTGPKTFPEAKAACTAETAHLVKITSASQNDVVAQLALGNDAFLGATDAITEGTFLWDDTTPLTFTMYGAGEPNNGNGMYEEDCLVMAGKRTPADTWDDRPCTADIVANAGSYSYVCEY